MGRLFICERVEAVFMLHPLASQVPDPASAASRDHCQLCQPGTSRKLLHQPVLAWDGCCLQL